MCEKLVHDYRIVVSGDEYVPPEVRRFHLQGEITIQGEVKKMTSSPIVRVMGDTVITRSGSTYILGQRADGYEPFSQVQEKHPGVPLT